MPTNASKVISLLPFDINILCPYLNTTFPCIFYSLRTASNTGFEVFVQNNGNIVVSALTRREYLATSVNTTILQDGQWHYITVSITPPKRPFSYSQINVFLDFSSRIAATLKMAAINEVITWSDSLFGIL